MLAPVLMLSAFSMIMSSRSVGLCGEVQDVIDWPLSFGEGRSSNINLALFPYSR